MPRFFTDSIDENNIFLDGENARHIGRSLRMRPNEELTVCCSGTDYDCVIRQITESCVYLDLADKHPCLAEPSVDVTLFQAVPKSDKLEFIIQKATELGASRIVPVLTERCISRPDRRDFSKKLARLQKIAEEAAKQSGRGKIPEITPVVSYGECLQMIKSLDVSVILYEGEGGKHFSEVPLDNIKTAGILIGSEGGFSAKEAEAAVNTGAERVWLGKRILRCETAPISALSILMFLTKNI